MRSARSVERRNSWPTIRDRRTQSARADRRTSGSAARSACAAFRPPGRRCNDKLRPAAQIRDHLRHDQRHDVRQHVGHQAVHDLRHERGHLLFHVIRHRDHGPDALQHGRHHFGHHAGEELREEDREYRFHVRSKGLIPGAMADGRLGAFKIPTS